MNAGGKRWEPTEPSYGAKVDWHFIEREAARFWGYALGAWMREEANVKADAIAHYLEHGTRESYASERAKAAAEKERHKDRPDRKMVDPRWRSQFSQSRG